MELSRGARQRVGVMNAKERFLGLLRELLTAGGALAFGAYDGAASAVGFIVALSSIGWAIRHHEGLQVLSTSIRKALSLVPGLLLAFNLIEPDKAGLLASFLAPAFALIWSYVDKGGNPSIPKGSGLALFALAASLALLTPSCSNLNPDQNDRLIDAAERIIIYVAK